FAHHGRCRRTDVLEFPADVQKAAVRKTAADFAIRRNTFRDEFSGRWPTGGCGPLLGAISTPVLPPPLEHVLIRGMNYGLVLFTSDRGITPAAAAKLADDHGFTTFYVPEHTHIPIKRQAAHPTTGDESLPDDRY